jgi:Protein of unknown function (DUF4242)
MVEAYDPNPVASRAEVAEALRRAAADVSTAGAPVRYLRSILLPSDETCFHLFEAPSVAAVRAAAVRADVVCTRIVEAVA